MATQTVTFARSLNDKITVIATTRDGWVTGLFVGSDGSLQYNVTTTETSGKPSQIWCREGDMSDVATIEPATPPAT